MSLYLPARAVTSAIGQALSELAGVVYTRLVADLPPAGHESSPPESLAAELETTIHFAPGGGQVVIEGEVITYTEAADALITGLVRDPFVTTTYPRGTLVAYLGPYSALDDARDSMLVDTAEGAYLAQLGDNYGVPRYLEVPDPVYRMLIETLAYMPGKGTYTSIVAFLEALLGDQGLEGTADARANAPRLEAAAGTFKPSMVGLLIDIETPTRTRRTKIVRVSVDGSTAYLDRWGSPKWQAADLADEDDVAFHVLPFSVTMPGHIPCTVWINVVTRPPENPLGFAYLQGDELVEPLQVDQVEVAHQIRQVLGVWLATDTRREGVNYATTNNFSGTTIYLDTDLPGGLPDVVVDYGWAYPGEDPAPVPGIPGNADGRATAEVLPDESVPNPEPIVVDGVQVGELVRYPLYLGGRLSILRTFMDALTVAGVIPEISVNTWES